MNIILAIAWKELYVTFRDRNSILIMFLTPIVLSTIMGLAFGGLAGDSNSSAFSDIPIAIVNLDEGFNLADQLDVADSDGEIPSLNDLEVEIGGETINVGEQLQLNPRLNMTTADLSAANAAFNFGDQPGSLDDLFAAVELNDVDLARVGVDDGTYVAAVIIPPDFSSQLMPNIGDETENIPSTSAVEVYGNQGQQISTSIVRAVVEGIVNQLVRISVALDSVLNTSINTVLENLNLSTLEDIDLSALDPALITAGIENLDASILEPLACLILCLQASLGCTPSTLNRQTGPYNDSWFRRYRVHLYWRGNCWGIWSWLRLNCSSCSSPSQSLPALWKAVPPSSGEPISLPCSW